MYLRMFNDLGRKRRNIEYNFIHLKLIISGVRCAVFRNIIAQHKRNKSQKAKKTIV